MQPNEGVKSKLANPALVRHCEARALSIILHDIQFLYRMAQEQLLNVAQF